MERSQLLQRYSELDRLVSELVALPPQLHHDAQAKVSEVRREVARAQVAEIPVARLKQTAKGLRLEPLERGGFANVLQVAESSPHRLTAIAGVGADTATRAIAAARQILSVTEQATVIRFNVDQRLSQQTELLDLLRRYETARRTVDDAQPIVEWFRQYSRGLPERIAELTATRESLERRSASLLHKWFSRQRTKDAEAQALEEAKRGETAAVGQLDYVMTQPQVHSLQVSLTDTLRVAKQHRSPDEIWDDYERNAAQLLATLSELSGGYDDPAAQGFLPAEIVERVEAMTLDLTMLKASLRGYQSFGARYALVQKRTILGDEMGLGKTVEALAALCHLRVGGKDTALVVCPASVVANWRAEIQRHTKLTSHVIHGASRDWALRNWHRQGGVGVTTFDALRRLDPGQLPVERPLAMLIVDEAHYVKNPSTKRSKAVAEWGRKAERVLFLTGTPMENRVEEFQALIAHLQPDVARRVDATTVLAGAHVFQATVAPAYLRRNQADVLDELPEMIQSLDWNEPTEADETAYRDAVERGSFMAMRRAAYESAAAIDLRTPNQIEVSAKLARLIDIAEEASEEGLKLVVFSFFRDVLATVARALTVAMPGAVYGPLTGSTSAPDRQRMVDALTEHAGGAVLVSQIEAGGVGLNIQAASVVILCEPQWKPTVEAQAIGRCHRMGQVRRVQVHRLLLEETVDQRMLEVLAGKQHLIDQFVRESAVKDASPAAVDISDLADVEKIIDEAQAEAAIIEWERRRMGLNVDASKQPNNWVPPTQT